jgi:hypothetical protein
MVRTILIPEKQDLSIHLPASYIGKKIEVIAFEVEEGAINNKISDQTLTHYASQSTLEKDWLTDEEDRAWQNL